jgi:di/tricarboxylate transporter
VSWQIAITFSVLGASVTALMLTRVAPDMVLLGGLVLLMLCGVVTPEEALGGFANEGLATIAALFVVAEGLRRTGGMNFVGTKLLGEPKSLFAAQMRLITPVAALSAFLNNTPIVAMMMPVVEDWARRLGVSVSKLLLPLSYAAILGGLITLIGTSTTLVVNGMLIASPGQRGFTMFELAWVGIPTTIVGLLYIPIASRWLLPPRKPALTQIVDPREYVVEMLVAPNCPVAGNTIQHAGLRHLPGMYLMEIQRGEQIIAAVGPDEIVNAGDRLVFVGVVESVVDLQKIPGLIPAADQLFKIGVPRSHRALVEAVVSSSSRVAGLTIRQAKFRTQYNAVVIAVARDGERVLGKIGDIRLQAGDTLLLETNPAFTDAHRNSRDFFLVSAVKDSTPVRHDRAWLARGILFAMVLLATFEVMSMLKAACVAGIAMVATQCLRVAEVKRSIEWSVLLAVGAGIGLGVAMDRSGAAGLIASSLISAVGTDPFAALVVIYVVTSVLANVITTKAAAVLVFPVALATAADLGVNFMPFAIALTVAAASAYATPIGYQTNLMVYGPGGYRAIDFLRIGAPLCVLVGIVTIVIAPLVWSFQ